LQQRGQRAHPLAGATGGLALDQAVAKMVLHHAGRVRRAAGVHHTANPLTHRDVARDLVARVDGRQTGASECATKAVEETPGHAVHRGQHHRVGIQQPGDPARQASQRQRFHRHDHQVLHAQLSAVV